MRIPRSAWGLGLIGLIGLFGLAEWDARFAGDPFVVDWVQARPLQPYRYRLASQWQQMSVRLEDGKSERPFVLRSGAFAAPKGFPKWIWVGPVQSDIPVADDPVWSRSVPQSGGSAETLCLWAHPSEKGKLTLVWPDVPAGSFHGLLHFLPAADPKAGVRLTVLWNGEPLGVFTPATRPGKAFFFRADLVTRGQEIGELKLVVEAKSKGRNHICLDGLVIQREEEPHVATDEAADSGQASVATASAPESAPDSPSAKGVDQDVDEDMEGDIEVEP